MKRAIARRALALMLVLGISVFSALYLVSGIAFEVDFALIASLTAVFAAFGFLAGLASDKDEGFARGGDMVADLVFGPEITAG